MRLDRDCRRVAVEAAAADRSNRRWGGWPAEGVAAGGDAVGFVAAGTAVV